VYPVRSVGIWGGNPGYSVRRYLELMRVLVVRNLKVRYRGSLLGVYWSLLNPLIMTGVYTLIFGTAFSSYYSNSIIRYMLEAFAGLAVINFFSASTTQALTSIVANGSMMNKIRLPPSIFPVSMVAANIFQFTVGTLPLLAIMAIATSGQLVNVVALLLPLLALVCASAGVGLLLSCLFVFFRDLIHLYELVLFLVLISSPIFYPEEIVPASVRSLLSLNPLFPIIQSLRQIALSGFLPDLHLVSQSILSGILVLMIGLVCFQRCRHQFMDLL
jgi:lipopolysaccharide transport system permease protein